MPHDESLGVRDEHAQAAQRFVMNADKHLTEFRVKNDGNVGPTLLFESTRMAEFVNGRIELVQRQAAYDKFPSDIKDIGHMTM